MCDTFSDDVNVLEIEEKFNVDILEKKIKKLESQKRASKAVIILMLLSNVITFIWYHEVRRSLNSSFDIILSIYKWIISQNIDLSKIFNNREIALGIWIVIVIFFLAFKKEISTSLLGVIMALLNKRFIILYIFMLMYAYIVVYFLHKVGYWSTFLLKDTIIWFIFTAIVSSFRAINAAKDFTYFKILIKDYIKLTIIFEFIVNTYTFSLAMEFFLIPLTFVVGAMSGMLDIMPEYKDKKYQPIKSCMTSVISGIGIIIILNSVLLTIKNFDTFISISSIKTLLLPSILSLLFLIFMYMFSLWSSYEQVFIRLKCGEKKSKSIILYTKFKISLFCKFNLKRVNDFCANSTIALRRIKSKDDINKIINSYKQISS